MSHKQISKVERWGLFTGKFVYNATWAGQKVWRPLVWLIIGLMAYHDPLRAVAAVGAYAIMFGIDRSRDPMANMPFGREPASWYVGRAVWALMTTAVIVYGILSRDILPEQWQLPFVLLSVILIALRWNKAIMLMVGMRLSENALHAVGKDLGADAARD